MKIINRFTNFAEDPTMRESSNDGGRVRGYGEEQIHYGYIEKEHLGHGNVASFASKYDDSKTVSYQGAQSYI